MFPITEMLRKGRPDPSVATLWCHEFDLGYTLYPSLNYTVPG